LGESIAPALHRLKRQSPQMAENPLEIKLLDFLYGEWGVISKRFHGFQKMIPAIASDFIAGWLILPLLTLLSTRLKVF
jgi:hypothetical protein